MSKILDLDLFRRQKQFEKNDPQAVFRPLFEEQQKQDNFTSFNFSSNRARFIEENNKRIIDFLKNTRNFDK